MMIKVILGGRDGRMGRKVLSHFSTHPDITFIDSFDKEDDLNKVNYSEADVYIDLTQPESVEKNIRFFSGKNISCVVGTSGISQQRLKILSDIQKKTKNTIIIAPNFSIGACLMIKFSKIASQYFKQGEIIELHHDGKKDKPSGTALYTSNVSGIPPENIHSIRLKGLLAHQHVIFGSEGETLTIKHDSTDRSCFMKGIGIAIKEACRIESELIMGLENILL